MSTSALLQQRVADMVAHFVHIQNERMVGIPILNSVLSVESVGFAWADPALEGAAPMGEGVLITPWFMSLLRLPAQVLPHRNQVGRKFVRDFGSERFDFIGAHDPAIGYHETCALFSPMQGFDSQARAIETAQAALALTRPQLAAQAPVVTREPVPSRRAFFFPGCGTGPGAAR